MNYTMPIRLGFVVAVLTMAAVMFCYWLSGYDFERGRELGSAVATGLVASVFMGIIGFAIGMAGKEVS